MADERFDRLMEMQERQQEQAMMRETLNMTRSSAVHDTPQPVPQPLQPPQWPYAQYPHYQAYPFPTPPPPQPAFPPPPPPQPESRYPRTVPDTAPPSRSSPLAKEDEEDIAIADFWSWKTSLAKTVEARMRLAEIRAIIDQEMWKTYDYRQMSDRSTAVYQRAIAQGVSDGFATHLRDDIHKYKAVWRGSYRPARLVANLRNPNGNGSQGEGGFER